MEFFTHHASDILQLVLAAVSTFILPAAYRLLHIHLDDKHRSYLEGAIHGAVSAGINAVAKDKGTTPSGIVSLVLRDQEVRDNVVAFAESYLHDNVPGALKKLGVSDGIAAIVETRIDGVVAALADHYLGVDKVLQTGAAR